MAPKHQFVITVLVIKMIIIYPHIEYPTVND